MEIFNNIFVRHQGPDIFLRYFLYLLKFLNLIFLAFSPTVAYRAPTCVTSGETILCSPLLLYTNTMAYYAGIDVPCDENNATDCQNKCQDKNFTDGSIDL